MTNLDTVYIEFLDGGLFEGGLYEGGGAYRINVDIKKNY